MIRRPPRSTQSRSSAASDVYKRQDPQKSDSARRHVGEPRFHLATRPLLTQHNRAALIVAYDMERVLADIDADHGDCGIELLRHGVLLVFGAPCQLKKLAGQEHGRTIPLADIAI